MIVLNCAARYGDFRRPIGAGRTVNEDVRGRSSIGAHVTFNIASGNMHIPYSASPGYDSPSCVVTDVTSRNIGLMNVHVIIKDSYSPVVVKMAIRHDQVPVIAFQVYPVKGFSDMDPANG